MCNSTPIVRWASGARGIVLQARDVEFLKLHSREVMRPGAQYKCRSRFGNFFHLERSAHLLPRCKSGEGFFGFGATVRLAEIRTQLIHMMTIEYVCHKDTSGNVLFPRKAFPLSRW